MKDFPIIFLDIDGVLNCQEYYTKTRGEGVKHEDYAKTYPLCEFDPWRIELLNDLVNDTGAKVVISSTWRHGRSIEEMRNLFKELKFSGEILDYTPSYHSPCMRGNEIYGWIEDNSQKLFGIYSSDFKNYVIIDDDSDMLLWQKDHFFQTDTYSGLTPNTCYRIKRFLKKTKNLITPTP